MPTQLSIYNGALRILGERKLADLTEDRPARYHLDDVWGGNVIRKCLELGQWKFAIRTRKITYSPSVSDTDFGYQYGFDRPSDLVRTTAISADEFFRFPLLDYKPEGAYWFCSYDTIYVSYVSDDASYGGDMSLWPESFTSVVEAFMAKEIAGQVKNGSDRGQIEEEFRAALAAAKSRDAMEGPSVKSPPGTFVMSRRGWYGRGRTHE